MWKFQENFHQILRNKKFVFFKKFTKKKRKNFVFCAGADPEGSGVDDPPPFWKRGDQEYLLTPPFLETNLKAYCNLFSSRCFKKKASMNDDRFSDLALMNIYSQIHLRNRKIHKSVKSYKNPKNTRQIELNIFNRFIYLHFLTKKNIYNNA